MTAWPGTRPGFYAILKRIMTTSVADLLLRAARRLARDAAALSFSPPVTHVYNPLEYAWEAHAAYLARFGDSPKRIVFLGMNPGPWGMAQTGVPFGEISHVRDWMGIHEKIGRPETEHPKRPIEGFDCAKSEVSGRRLWGLMAERFGPPGRFFESHFVANYCPLVFMEETGRNRTPDKLPRDERDALFSVCDDHLVAVLDALQPETAIGVGKFAETRLKRVTEDGGARASHAHRPQLLSILHPSPASPRANRDWSGEVTRALEAAGVW
jgi:single-strand selective monofunctional uracil DNA glycosylase